MLDQTIESVAPGMALSRHKARTALAYRAARKTPDRESAPGYPPHPDSAQIQRDRITLMNEARDLAENVGFVKGHLRKVQLYSAGTLTYEPDTGDEGMDSEIREFLDWWTPVAHSGLSHSMTRLVQLAVMGMTRDGDSLLVWCRDEDIMRLQIVEADQIGELHSYANKPGYAGGVHLNGDGSRWGYRVYDRIGDMQYGHPQDIPAESAVFLSDPMRPMIRSITAYETSIQNLRDKYEILGYEKLVVKELSTEGIVTYTQRGSADDLDAYIQNRAPDNGGGMSYMRRIGGIVREYMGIGEKFDVIPHNRPSPTFQGFIKTLDEEDCAGLNLPYGFLVDPTAAGGASIRIVAHMANREFERLQSDVINPALCQIRDIILLDAMDRGYISNHPRLLRGSWMFPPPPTADIQRESDIAIRETRAGLSTYTEQFARYGQNRARQWKTKQQEIIDKYRLAAEATKTLQAEGINVVVSPDEIASMSDNPAPPKGEATRG